MLAPGADGFAFCNGRFGRYGGFVRPSAPPLTPLPPMAASPYRLRPYGRTEPARPRRRAHAHVRAKRGRSHAITHKPHAERLTHAPGLRGCVLRNRTRLGFRSARYRATVSHASHARPWAVAPCAHAHAAAPQAVRSSPCAAAPHAARSIPCGLWAVAARRPVAARAGAAPRPRMRVRRGCGRACAAVLGARVRARSSRAPARQRGSRAGGAKKVLLRIGSYGSKNHT